MNSEEKNQSAQEASDLSMKPYSTEDVAEHACPQCHHVNEADAAFCAECGIALQQLAKCHKCGAIARPRADICEVCGTWLLKGQCMFCYAHMEDDETFCSECGNPTKGITCPRCGKLSIFDFCTACSIPLSVQAKEMVKATAQDPDYREMAALFEQLSDAGGYTVSCEIETKENVKQPHDDQALGLRAYRESLEKPADYKTKRATKALFSHEQKKSINQLNEVVAQEEERRRIEEERKRREAEERRRQEEERRRVHERRMQEQLNETMLKIGSMRFSSNQEARRFFMNIMAGLPEEVIKKIRNTGRKWRCNAYDCVHDSPSECADPSRGGVWLIQ